MIQKVLFTLALTSLLLACSNDDEPKAPEEITITITEADYTADGTPTIEFSLDDGATWSTDVPQEPEEGTTFKAKVTDGLGNDLQNNDFFFDWAASDPQPDNTTAEEVTFTVGTTTPNIALTISEKTILVTIHETLGELYTLDKNDGNRSIIYTTQNDLGTAIDGLFALTYHPETGTLFAGQGHFGSYDGYLYEIDIPTGTATVKNDNSNSDGLSYWGNLLNIAIIPDGSMLTFTNNIDIPADAGFTGDAFITFNTNGETETTYINTNGEHIRATFYDTATQTLYGRTADKEISTITLSNGEATFTNPITIDIWEGFDGAFNPDNASITAMVKDNTENIVYALAFQNNNHYLITLDLQTQTATYIGGIGDTFEKLFNCLAFVPLHKLP